jgi:hypothetical protein
MPRPLLDGDIYAPSFAARVAHGINPKFTIRNPKFFEPLTPVHPKSASEFIDTLPAMLARTLSAR